MIYLTEKNFDTEVLKSDKKTVVDFYADWCVPCKMLAPVIEKLAEENSDWKFCKLNVDECPKLAIQYSVNSIPMVGVFENGELLDTIVGFRDEEELKDFIECA